MRSAFLFQILGEDSGGALYFRSAGATLVVLGCTGRGDVAVWCLLVAIDTLDLGTDQAPVLFLRLGEQILHHLIAGRFAFAI